jgi:hypothetical protein
VAQVSGAQAQLEANIEDLRRAAVAGGDAASLAQAEGQLAGLGKLQRRLEQAGPGALAAIRAEVVAFVAASQATASLVRTSAATAQSTEAALHVAQAEARRTVADFTRDFYERKVFDGDLKFASAEDERAYREREEKFRREIEKARAEGTPEGDLRALQLAKAQLLDAGAHGADQNPAYAPMLSGITTASRDLEAAIPTKQAASRIEVATAAPAESAPVELPADVLAAFRANSLTTSEPVDIAHGVTARDQTGSQRRGRDA